MAAAPDLVRRHTVFTTKLAASIQKTAILGQYQGPVPGGLSPPPAHSAADGGFHGRMYFLL